MPDSIEYLEDERKKLWAEVVKHTDILNTLTTTLEELKKQIQEIRIIAESKVTEDESAIKGIRNKTSEYKNKIVESYNTVNNVLSSIQEKSNNIEELDKSIQLVSVQINDIKLNVEQKSDEMNKTYETIMDINQNYDDELEKCNSFVEISEQKISELENIEEQISKMYNNVKTIESNMQNFQAKSAERRNEIKEIYNEIFGSHIEDGEETEGLKDELDSCYDELIKSFEKLKKDYAELKISNEKDFDNFKNSKENDFSELKNKIQSLLPGAMSAGLSYAYNQKRRREEKSKKHFEITFNIAIGALVIIATIPVTIAAVLLFKIQMGLVEIIKFLPQLLGLITPFYLPVVWIALSASKKANQSKRLIEEYAHKEAISKTYEGLSKEVSKLNDEDSLKEKLLLNIITTNAENPGKLLQGFNKPDYPMLEIIDKFTKLLKSAKSTDEIQSIMEGLVSISRNVSGYETKLENPYHLTNNCNSDEDDEDE